MRKRIQTFAVMLAIFVIRCAAQDVVLTSTSSTYPNQRGQWSEAQGEAWQKKYGPIIGVNCPYPPCGAISQEQSIALAASLGYNSIRWWFHDTQNAEGLSLLDWLYSERRRSVTTARNGRSADEMILRWAYKQGRHIISRDGFQDDPAYTWLQESAKAHYPRLHKYYTHDGVIEIPNLGIEATFNKVA